MSQAKKILSPSNIIFSTLLALYIGIAILEQLRRPPEDRTWHGNISGIPYDFRLPTAERLRATYWNRSTSQILVPKVFGIGWTINLYPLLHPEKSQSL